MLLKKITTKGVYMFKVEESKMQEIRGMMAACKFAMIAALTGNLQKGDADYFNVLLDHFEKSLSDIPYSGGE